MRLQVGNSRSPRRTSPVHGIKAFQGEGEPIRCSLGFPAKSPMPEPIRRRGPTPSHGCQAVSNARSDSRPNRRTLRKSTSIPGSSTPSARGCKDASPSVSRLLSVARRSRNPSCETTIRRMPGRHKKRRSLPWGRLLKAKNPESGCCLELPVVRRIPGHDRKGVFPRLRLGFPFETRRLPAV